MNIEISLTKLSLSCMLHLGKLYVTKAGFSSSLGGLDSGVLPGAGIIVECLCSLTDRFRWGISKISAPGWLPGHPVVCAGYRNY